MSVDVALLSLGTTPGLRRADDAFATLLAELGLDCRVVRVAVGHAGRLRRHPAVTDLVEALAARRSAGHLPAARAVVISTVTAGLLHRPNVPYAIRFDAPAAVNRPGLAGAWQRAAERAAVRRAPLLLPWSAEAAAALGEGARRASSPWRSPSSASPPQPSATSTPSPTPAIRASAGSTCSAPPGARSARRADW